LSDPQRAFRLAISEERLATLTFDMPGRPVNILDRAVLEELEAVVRQLAERRDVRSLVLLSAKPRNFIAGADVDAIEAVTDPTEVESACRRVQRLYDAWEALPFPTIAAIRGTCLGGGGEWSLACDHILTSDRDDIRIGWPEVKLGILPAWGGCTRLPERVGLRASLELVLTGTLLHPKKAFKIGLADALLPDAAFERLVHEFAVSKAGANGRRRRPTDLRSTLLEGNPLGRGVVFDQARKQTLRETRGHYPAPLRALEVIRIAVSEGRERSLEAEARAAGELATSVVSKSLVHVFRMMEAAKKDRGEVPAARPIRRAAVLGAGVMGGGIAQLLAAQRDLPVRMKDLDTGPLAGGMRHAEELLGKLVSRRRISKVEAKRKLALIRPTLDYSGFASADIVIEAIVEVLEVKQRVLAEVAAVTGEETILASNTSSLSIDLIGARTPRPERVVGMHFFNPVHKMPLVEVVVGGLTSAETTQTVVELTRSLGKTPVVVRSGPGFLVNRLLTFYNCEALWMLDEGQRIERIDEAIVAWGMPMGPLALTDEVGIDVANKVGHIMADAYPDRLSLPDWVDRMIDPERLGAKTGAGLYRYEKGRRTEPDPGVYERLGIAGTADPIEATAIAERAVLPMVNEAARCLDEGIVASPADVDLAMILGTGFPPFRGGLCRWADGQGLERLLDEMERLAERFGERHRPSRALREIAGAGGFYAA
jgi:3-hydroxyacyl-CoA dehydrogenase/enoyl-CoA hydratase/3-hydroxybutyryl-CoA epimerase